MQTVDPDQMPCSVASDLGLHCLPMSHLWDTRHKWVNKQVKCISVLYVSNFSIKNTWEHRQDKQPEEVVLSVVTTISLMSPVYLNPCHESKLRCQAHF